jgi:hypothetical protein
MDRGMTDVYLGYRGGSGGFLLLHLLLYSGDYHLCFKDGFTFNDAIAMQWNIPDSNLWKNTEIWPDRHETMCQASSLPCIFYYCNPDIDEYFWTNQKYIVSAYQKIKDQSWPDIEDFKSYSRLPRHIRHECEIQHDLAPLVRRYATHKKFVWLYTDIDSQNELAFYKKANWYADQPEKPKQGLLEYGIYNDTRVDIEAVPFLLRSNITLRLQDVVTNPSVLVDKGLIRSVDSRHTALISKWLSLHPREVLQKIRL